MWSRLWIFWHNSDVQTPSVSSFLALETCKLLKLSVFVHFHLQLLFKYSAWIEENNIKPFEGPWKDELAKVSKPAAFRHAMTDIERYIDDPAEVDEQINDSCGVPNHATEADFDKIRDGLDGEENAADEASTADGNNGVVPHVVGSPDEGDSVENNADSSASPSAAVTTTPATTGKSGGKRTPKAKSVSAVSVSKSAKASASKSAQKRRVSAHQTPSGASSAKRGRRVASGDVAGDEAAGSSPNARRRIETDALMASLAAKRAPNAIALLDRPVVTRPETQAIDMNSRSNTLADRDIVPSEQTFGFLGLGMMGSTIVKDLIYTGHKVVVWNRTIDKVSCLLNIFKDRFRPGLCFIVSTFRGSWSRG